MDFVYSIKLAFENIPTSYKIQIRQIFLYAFINEACKDVNHLGGNIS